MKIQEDSINYTLAAFAKICTDKDEIPYFKNDKSEIYTFFYQMQKEYPEFFGGIRFDTKGPFPWSDDIENSFNSLMISRLLKLLTPDFDPYKLESKVLKITEEIPLGQIKIFEVAQRFYDKFCCDENGQIRKHSKIL